jgi:hypothetical protein
MKKNLWGLEVDGLNVTCTCLVHQGSPGQAVVHHREISEIIPFKHKIWNLMKISEYFDDLRMKDT